MSESAELKSLKENHERLLNALKRLNGSNLIVPNKKGEVLVGRAKYGEKKLMLPGGAVERGEKPSHAAISETEEETGIIVQETATRKLGMYLQRIAGVESATGFLFLYEAKEYSGSIPEGSETEELTDIQFMSISQVIDKHFEDDFSLAYVRMIIHFAQIKKGLLHKGFEKRLSEKAIYTHNNKLVSI
jgi:8-oxo-dGTP pyrophosphatase MutT (NUDIX family)